jgi:hypothetical protein
VVIGVLLCCGGLTQAAIIDFNSVNPLGTIQVGDNYDQVTLHDSAIATMTGGTAESVWSYDSSAFQMQSGNISMVISVHNASTVTISGGSVGDLELFNSGVATISGGNITGHLGIWNMGIVNIYGKNFNYTHDPYNSGWLITGNWVDESPFTIFYRMYEPFPNSHVVFHEIPEPATMLLLGFGMMLAGKKLRR